MQDTLSQQPKPLDARNTAGILGGGGGVIPPSSGLINLQNGGLILEYLKISSGAFYYE
ncbi:hypothetical protein [Helicobacter labacensis]|uniref:hypothetical protein n=1 Tax=Helicobacter labacensis TaxID=2316079 RepID=UPI0013CDE970|nr:hypothetical protein [Helicobacter labacensis]